MKKRLLRRLTLWTVFVMTGFFGFPGLAMANQASISNTGPDSYNKIKYWNSDKCEAENNNNVNVKNINFQNASSGDAVVGSNWGAYAPEKWQAKGASYGEWRAAVNSHMNSYRGDWKNKGGGNTVGGDATSGDATNTNSTRTNVSIDNSGACADATGTLCCDENGHPVKPGQKPTHDKYGHVLAGATGANGGGFGGSGGYVLGVSSGSSGVGGQGGSGGAFHPWNGLGGGSGGGSGSGSGGSGYPSGDDDSFSIDNTGPDSVNKIDYSSSTKTSVTNNNNVSVTNLSKQHASSGDATVSGNTSAGSATSGDATNTNSTKTSVEVNN